MSLLRWVWSFFITEVQQDPDDEDRLRIDYEIRYKHGRKIREMGSGTTQQTKDELTAPPGERPLKRNQDFPTRGAAARYRNQTLTRVKKWKGGRFQEE